MAGPKEPEVRHRYFNETDSSEWDITSFLDSELATHGTAHFSFDRALGDWNSALRQHAQSSNAAEKTAATQKLTFYKNHPGHLSDKTRALDWSQRKKKRKLNPDHRQGQVHINFSGPVVSSTINCGAVVPDPTGTATLEQNSRGAASPPPEHPISTRKPCPEVDSKSRLYLLCLSLKELRNTLLDPLRLPSGIMLEDCFYPYVFGLLELDPAHGFIADSKLLSTLAPPDRAIVLGLILPLPTFPAYLDVELRSCICAPQPTIRQCRELAGNAQDRDLLWISRVTEHMVDLITHDVLTINLGEGTFDSTVNPVLWDNYFLDVPGHVLHRKEITILSMQHQPYQYLNLDPRFDGVFRSRPSALGPNYEIALFEVSRRYDGPESRKWKRDKAKLLAGCRAMLYRLKELVDHDKDTVRKLRVVGVLQAGLHSQLLVLQFVNSSMLHVREGNVRELPSTLRGLLEGLPDVVAVAWKAKRIVTETVDVITAYLKTQGTQNMARTAPDFL